MKKERIDQLLADLWDSYDRGNSMVRATAGHQADMLSGTYPAKLKRDILSLPAYKKAPGLIKAFGSYAHYLVDDDSEKILLFPDLLIKEKIEPDVVGMVKAMSIRACVEEDGSVAVSGACSLFGTNEGLSIAGCGLHLELLRTTELILEMERHQPIIDEALDRHPGLPIGAA